MIKVYGSELCPDCVAAKKQFDEAGIDFVFADITASLAELKAFLKVRDGSDLFDAVRKRGGVGIPCIIKDDGTVTLDPAEIIAAFKSGAACSLDGRGC